MYKVIIHPNNLKFIEFYNRDNFHVILSNYGASIYEIGSVDKRGVTARFKIRDIPYRIQPNDGVNLLHSGFNT